MSSLVTLKAKGLQTQPNQLGLEEGSLSIASNVVINRDDIIEKRRGFKLYGNSFGSSTDVSKQLMQYRDQLIRHYSDKLQFDNGSGTFSTFPGSFLEPEIGIRIKSVAANNNFYFTTSKGVKKISAATSNLDNSTISNAGGIKAIDISSVIKYNYRSLTGFLPEDSTVAYRAVWGIKDVNNNLILGTPSPRSEIYNPITPIMNQDFNHLLQGLDNAAMVPGAQTLTDTNYSATLGLLASTDGVELRTNLIALCEKLDLDIYSALPALSATTSSLPAITTAVWATNVITYTFTSAHGLSIGDSVTVTSSNPGGYNGTFTVNTVPSATTITRIESTDPGAYVSSAVAVKNVDVAKYSLGPPRIVTYRFASAHGLSSGDKVRVSGIAPDTFNGTFTIVATTTTTIDVAVTSDPGTYISGGVITKIKYQAIERPPELPSPQTSQSLRDLQTYMNLIITTLQSSPSTEIDTSNLTTYIDPLDITTTSTVNMTVYIPDAVISAGVNQYFLQLYRSSIFEATGTTVLSDLIPNDEMRLVYEAFPTQAELTAGVMYFEDVTPDAFAGAYLYTNESTGEGALQANDAPPFAKDIARFKNVIFYANTKTTQKKILSLLGISGMITDYNNTIIPKLTITNGDNTVTYSFVVGLQQITDVTCGADTANSLNGKYFDIYSAQDATKYRFYYKTSGGVDTPPAVTTETLVKIEILTGSTANIVAQKTLDTINIYSLDLIATNNTLPIIRVSTVASGYTTASSAGTSGFTVTTFQSGRGASSSLNEILLSSSVSPAVAVDETARSLVNIINKDSLSPVYAYYLSTAGGVPGKIQLESRSLNSDTVYILTNNSTTGQSFNPDFSPTSTITAISSSDPCVITTSVAHGLVNGSTVVISSSTSPTNIDGKYSVLVVSSTQFSIPVDTSLMTPGSYTAVYSKTEDTEASENDTKSNRVFYSKLNQPEAVPLVNYFDVGDSDKAILRIFPLRDSLFVFKEEGLYRISGEIAPFSLSLFDSSVRLVAQDSLGIVSNLIFAWTKKGIETISESGASLISRPIDNDILKLSSNNYTNFGTATFGLGYESDKSYLVWTVKKTTDTIANICYRYSTVTGAWTTYDKTNTCGILKLIDDKLYLGAGDINYTEQERKTFTRTDYADRELTFTLDLGGYQQNKLKLSSVVGISVGDALAQSQDLTVYIYNMLLKKLDSDPGTGYTGFYSNYKANSGDNLRNKIVDLAQKLDTLSLGFTDYFSRIDQKLGSIGAHTIGGTSVIITSTAHGLQTGRYINIANNTSTPSLNGNWTVTVIDANTFTINTVVTTAVIDGTWITLNDSFPDIQGSYNLIIENLNSDTVVNYSNYLPVTTSTEFEAIVTDVDTLNKIVTLNYALPYIVGPFVVYKSFNTAAVYSPVTMGDPLGVKHIREATVMFENKIFTEAVLSFASDLLPQYNPITFSGDGNGIYGNDTFGNKFFGGASSGAPFRTYIPRNNQRCRYLNVKLEHNIARENIVVYGITLTGEVGLSTRGYR